MVALVQRSAYPKANQAAFGAGTSMKDDSHSEQVKIAIPLLGSARDSGFESETVWAERLGENRYRIWNLPVFAYNIDMRAIVQCAPGSNGELPVVVRVLEPGDCFVVRLFFSDSASDQDIESVLDLLKGKRALFEKYNRRLWAVGLRSTDDYDWLGPALDAYVERGILRFESGFQPNEPGFGAA